MAEALPEVWLRGPLENIPALLQPAAHALLQAMEEMNVLMKEFPEHLLWERPAGVASPGFHLLHITGVLNRLCTYARAGLLNEEQLAYLKSESERQDRSVSELIEMLQRQVNQTLKQFSETDESTLTELRSVGRKGLPSTVQGLLFHAAEHTMRHLGQLLVTVKLLKAGSSG
jgi:uncharacterized damage-inducible protein DinB